MTVCTPRSTSVAFSKVEVCPNLQKSPFCAFLLPSCLHTSEPLCRSLDSLFIDPRIPSCMIQVEEPILSVHPKSYSPFQIRSRISRPRSVDWSCPSVDCPNSLLKSKSTALCNQSTGRLSVEKSVD